MAYFQRLPPRSMDPLGAIPGLPSRRVRGTEQQPAIAAAETDDVVRLAGTILEEELLRGGLTNLSTSMPAELTPATWSERPPLTWPTDKGLDPNGSFAQGFEGLCPVVRTREPTSPGHAGELFFTLENDSPDDLALSFRSTDFVSDSGAAFPASCLSSSPATLHVGGQGRSDATFVVRVPAHTPTGQYSALVLAEGIHDVRAVLVVSVVPH